VAIDPTLQPGAPTTIDPTPLRLGILGAARITNLAVIKPARIIGTRLVAVAARDSQRATAFAKVHNATEAEEVAEQVSGNDRQFFEGFHYLWYPLIARLHAILTSGELGDLRHVETVMDMPAPDPADPRWSLALSGGALMDLGCYSLHSMRVLAPYFGGEPALISATGGEREGNPGVDEWVTAELQFPNGVTGTAGCNMASDHHQMSHRLIGSSGEAVVTDFVNPHNDDRLIVTTRDGTRTEHLGTRSSYTYQLEAFTAAVRSGVPARTDAIDAVMTMRLIDKCYQAIGMQPQPHS